MARLFLPSLLVLASWLILGSTVGAQTSPADLVELSLDELVDIEVLPNSQNTGRWLVGYRFIEKDFEGYLEGTRSLSFEEMLGAYPVVPTKIHQQAHLLETSFRWNDSLSLSLTMPFIEQSTDHIRRVGSDFNITTRGIGDLLLSAAVRIPPIPGADFTTLNIGLGVPTGSIDKKGDTPRGNNTQVPYTMQTGTGTWSFEPGFTASGRRGAASWKVQALAVLRLGRNDRDYSLGDRMLLTTRIGLSRDRRVVPWLKTTLEIWKAIDGADLELDPTIAPVADARLFGGERVDMVAGLEIRARRAGSFEIAGGAPVYQSLNGPQPKRRWEWTAGWKSRWF